MDDFDRSGTYRYDQAVLNQHLRPNGAQRLRGWLKNAYHVVVALLVVGAILGGCAACVGGIGYGAARVLSAGVHDGAKR